MIDKIDEYQNISQIGNALQTLIEGIDDHVNSLQQGVSRSASIASYGHSNTSDKRKGSISNESNSDENSNQKKNRFSNVRSRKNTEQYVKTNLNADKTLLDNHIEASHEGGDYRAMSSIDLKKEGSD
jgi:hypothetical protein